jgi:hypothetical protein
MWGKHLVLDRSSCDREAIHDAQAIRGSRKDRWFLDTSANSLSTAQGYVVHMTYEKTE